MKTEKEILDQIKFVSGNAEKFFIKSKNKDDKSFRLFIEANAVIAALEWVLKDDPK